jgi:hypothetical protein
VSSSPSAATAESTKEDGEEMKSEALLESVHHSVNHSLDHSLDHSHNPSLDPSRLGVSDLNDTTTTDTTTGTATGTAATTCTGTTATTHITGVHCQQQLQQQRGAELGSGLPVRVREDLGVCSHPTIRRRPPRGGRNRVRGKAHHGPVAPRRKPKVACKVALAKPRKRLRRPPLPKVRVGRPHLVVCRKLLTNCVLWRPDQEIEGELSPPLE